MRWLAAILVALTVALQYPLWFGKGGWLAARALDRQVAAQRAANDKLKLRNDTLEADVRDLKTGSEAIEERARAELGMIKHDEVLFQLQPAGGGARTPAKPVAPTATGSAGKAAAPATSATSGTSATSAKPATSATSATPPQSAAPSGSVAQPASPARP